MKIKHKYLFRHMFEGDYIYHKYKIARFMYLHSFRHIAQIMVYKLKIKHQCIISYKSIIGEGLKLPHPMGIVIGEGVTIGENVSIYQNVTIGRKYENIDEYPIIGNNVTIYANSIILGKVKIGDGAVIGCNSIVFRNVKQNEVVKGIVK